MNPETLSLLALRGATAAAGLLFLLIAAGAYAKHRNPAMLWLIGAISLMVLAALAELVVFLVFGAGLGIAEIVEASLTLLAFLVLLWSVRAQPLDEKRAV